MNTTEEEVVSNVPECLQQVTVFNNYYFALLKKLKDTARANKKADSNRVCINSIKTHYASYNRNSSEYREFYIKSMADVCADWSNLDEGREWLSSNSERLVFMGDLTVAIVREICNDDALLLYFMTALNIMSADVSEQSVSDFVEANNVIKSAREFTEKIDTIADETLKKRLSVMGELYTASMKTGVEDSMKGIEGTSLGKLAKEIMDEVDVSTLSDTLTSDGDILKTLGNPDSGLTKLLGTVSQKLISKMASGEISNDTLIKDAMQFSSKLGKMPGMPSNMPDMSGMMSMFQNMMSDGAQGRAAPAHHTRVRTDSSKMSRIVKAKQLKRKLDEKKKAKENV